MRGVSCRQGGSLKRSFLARGAMGALICALSAGGASAAAQTADRFLISEVSTASARIFNVSDHADVGSIPVGSTPDGVVIAPNGRLAYVANLNSSFVSVIDLTIGAEIARIHGARARSLAMNADGSRLVAAGADPDDEALVVDTSDFSIHCSSGNGFHTAGLRNDASDSARLVVSSPVVVGNRAYFNTPSPGGGSLPRKIGVLDLNDCSVSAVDGSDTDFATFNIRSMAATPDGSLVVAARTSSLLLIDPTTDSVAGTIGGLFGFPGSVGADVVIADHPGEGTFAYVVTGPFIFALTPPFPPVEVKAINLATGTLAGSAVLPLPVVDGNIFSFNFDVALSPDSSRLYVTARFIAAGNVAEVDTQMLRSGLPGSVTTLSLGADMRGIAAAAIPTQPPFTAPTVSAVEPSIAVNDTSTPITVTGSNFDLGGAVVRLGSLDPIAATVNSSSELTVVVPAISPAQGADIIVTNRNGTALASDHNQSGILRGADGDPAFTIVSPPTFQPVNQVLVGNFGEGTVAVLNISTNATVAPTTRVVSRPFGVAITPDAERAYLGAFFPGEMGVFNIVSGEFETTIPLAGGATSQEDGVAVAPNPGIAGGSVLAFVVSGSFSTGPGEDDLLHIIDADPASATFNQVITTISSGSNDNNFIRGALATTPDGHYVYSNSLFLDNSDGWLSIFDVFAGTIVSRPLTSSLGVGSFQGQLHVTPDGGFLLMAGPDGSVRVFDISTPTTPSMIATVASSDPGRVFARYTVAANRLFALDLAQNTVEVFNFDPATPDYSHLGSFVIPGTPGNFGGGLEVTPDGALIYAVLSTDDAVAVLDTALLIDGNPATTPLLTKIHTGLSPATVVFRPGTPTDLGSDVAVQPIKEVSLSFSNVTSSGDTTVTTTNTNPTPTPAGFAVGDPPIYYEIDTTATFAGPVEVCFTYEEKQFDGPESKLRVLHEEGGEFVDVTVSVDPGKNEICALVNGFSAFLVGLASVDYFFDQLLSNIAGATDQPGVRRSLQAKTIAARASHDRGDDATAANQLNALKAEIEALVDIHLSESEAQLLLDKIDEIVAGL